ncbi:Hypothetical protein FKW44_013875 [Caligus rogercresseyi]|uniref:Uncharacterized protein n=1 Tax=Caligus rogercresseyi TaxID=217165 RepID=A0A7T8GYR4_CALRO|nr:Hypothetical protein FKW44_013875 [Caligus rogercresseyi]
MPPTRETPGGEAFGTPPSSPTNSGRGCPPQNVWSPYLGIMQRNSNSNGYPDPSPFTPNNSTTDSAGNSLAGRMDGSPMESMPGPATLPSGATATFPTEPIYTPAFPAGQNVSLLLGRIAREIADLTASLQV